MEIAIVISAFIANLVTQVFKPRKFVITDEQKEARKLIIRMFNAVVGGLTLIGTAYFLGEPLDTEGLAGFIEVVVTTGIVFVTAQGGYFLTHKKN